MELLNQHGLSVLNTVLLIVVAWFIRQKINENESRIKRLEELQVMIVAAIFYLLADRWFEGRGKRR